MRRLLLFLLAACSSRVVGPPDAGFMPPTPIRYVVVIVKENHTFDNYFTGFPGTDDAGGWTAPISDGGIIQRPQAVDGVSARDMSHSHDNAITGWNEGQMNGFDRMVDSKPKDGGPADYLPYSWYSEAQLPNYWTYAKQFVLFDRFFSDDVRAQLPRAHRADRGAVSGVLEPDLPGHEVRRRRLGLHVRARHHRRGVRRAALPARQHQPVPLLRTFPRCLTCCPRATRG